MKAKRLLQLYASGRRDFRGENLRGQNFKGQDLRGADFSGADIRSTNFTNANLEGAKFCQAKAGLQKRWVVSLLLISFLLAGVSGFLSGFLGYIVTPIFDTSNLENMVAGWIALIALIIFFIVTLRTGIGYGLGAVASTGAVAAAFVFAFTVTFEFAIAVAVAGAISVVGVVTAIAIAGLVAAMVAVAIAVIVAVVAAYVSAGIVAVAVAVVVISLSRFIAWQSMRENPKYVFIRILAVAFAAPEGTSFRGANLTDADLSQAQLKSTDFRRADLTRTYWRNTSKLDLARPGNSYLLSPDVRQLVVTGNGQKQSFDHLQNLRGINLRGANLVSTNFLGSTLKDGTLQGANLSDVNLTLTNLNHTNLKDTNLSRANLSQAQLDGADLTGATLTGATIDDWGVTTKTSLDGIQCDYVYMRQVVEGDADPNPHRKPDDWNKNFEPGEFVDFITPLIETLDLYHNQSADPRAVAIAFNELRDNNPDTELEIVSMEKRGKYRDKFLLRAETHPKADLSALHGQYFQRYNELRALPSETLQALLIEKERENQRLASLVGTAVNRPSLYAENYHNQGDTMPESPKYDLKGASFGGGFATEGATQTGGINQTSSGSMTGNMQAAVGDHNQQTQSAATPTQILELLAQLEQQIHTSSALPEADKQKATTYLGAAKTEIEEEAEPDKALIAKNLERVTKTLKAADGSLEAGKELWEESTPVLQKVAGWLGTVAKGLLVLLG